jgi:hypothetical protein
MATWQAPELPVLRAYDASGAHLYSLTTSQYELFLSSLDELSAQNRQRLSDIAGEPWPVLVKRVQEGGPVHTQRKYHEAKGLTFWDLENVVDALKRDCVRCELRDTGRPIYRA